MGGKRNSTLGDFVTNWSRVRLNVVGVDLVGPADPTILPFSTKGGPNDAMFGGAIASDGNFYGRNAQIDFAVIIQGFSVVTLQLWLLVEETSTPLVNQGDSPPVLDAILQPVSTMWVLVDTKVFGLASGWWVVKDIPPGQYKVLVSTITGAGAVTVFESHAA